MWQAMRGKAMTENKSAKDTRNIYQRLAAAMSKVSYVQKNKPEKMQYSIVSHDAVTAKVRPALLAEGIHYAPHNMEYQQNGNRTEVFLVVRFTNIDDPKDVIDVPSLGYGVDGQDKGPGKAVSYAVKYALLKVMGLETGDDADNESVDHVVTITADQFVELQAKIEEAGVDADKIAKSYKIDAIDEMKASDFPNAIGRLTATIKQNVDAAPKDGDGNADEIPH